MMNLTFHRVGTEQRKVVLNRVRIIYNLCRHTLHPQIITVRCDLWAGGVLGPDSRLLLINESYGCLMDEIRFKHFLSNKSSFIDIKNALFFFSFLIAPFVPLI